MISILRKHSMIITAVFALAVIGLGSTFAAYPLDRSHPIAFVAIIAFLAICVVKPHIGVLAMVATYWLSTLVLWEGAVTLNRVIGISTLFGILLPWITSRTGRKSFLITSFDYVFWAYLATAILSVAANGIFPSTLDLLWDLVMGYLLYWLTTNTTNSESKLKALLWVIVLCNLVIALSIIYAFIDAGSITPLQRYGGFQQVNRSGVFNSVAIMIVLWIWSGSRRPLHGLVCLLLVVIFGWALFLTGSRSGFISLLLSLICAIIVSPRRKKKVLNFVALGLFVAIGIVLEDAMPQSGWRVLEFPIFEPQLRGLAGLASEERYYLNLGAWRMFKSHPLLGIGVGGFSYTIGRYLPSIVLGTPSAHNVFAGTLAEMGILGFLGLSLLWGVGVSGLWRNAQGERHKQSNEVRSALYPLAILVGVSANALMHGDIIDRLLFLVFALCIILTGPYQDNLSANNHSQIPQRIDEATSEYFP